jgi:hypothetical protein
MHASQVGEPVVNAPQLAASTAPVSLPSSAIVLAPVSVPGMLLSSCAVDPLSNVGVVSSEEHPIAIARVPKRSPIAVCEAFVFIALPSVSLREGLPSRET